MLCLKEKSALLNIGTVELGLEPKVILALEANSVDGIKNSLDRARNLRIDLIEARLDLLKNSLEELEVLDIIGSFGFYCVSVIRPKWEGGGFSGSESERLSLFERVISHPSTGAVDIELKSDIVLDVVELAKKNSRKVIISYHDFEKVPSNNEIESLFKEAVEKGADIVKLAFMGKSQEDAARVCCVLSKFNHPKIFMVMGEVGSFTRVVGFSFGSLLTYTFFGKPVAPGQIEAERLIKLLSNLYPSYRKKREKFFSEEFFQLI